MSVVKSKRGLSSAQYLENLRLLEVEVLTWCKSQGRKNDSFGLTDLFGAAKNAYAAAVYGNMVYLKTEDDAAKRKEYFDKSIRWLRVFNSELTALAPCYLIPEKKIERWMGYVAQAIAQMESIKKSDKSRTKKK